MISHDLRCVFIHVPKTGGTSIEKAILRSLNLTWEQREKLSLFDNRTPSDVPVAHMSGPEYVRFGYLTEQQWVDYFSFAFVRNPWDRLVSEYRYRFSHGMSFAEFVDYSFSTELEEERRHIIPQSSFLDGVDFIGRFESLKHDFATVAERIGISVNLEHHNAGEESKASIVWRKLNRMLFNRDPGVPKAPFQSYYTPELRDRVGEYYAQDVGRFGYRFDASCVKQDALVAA